MNEPTCNCPYCDSVCYADWCDVGCGAPGIQCGPYYCENCRASEIGPYDDLSNRTLTEEETKTGWFKPNSELGSSVNKICNTPVDHKTAKRLYEFGLLE